MRLNDKVALVTGGASGFGAAIVRRFADEGAKVLIGDIQDAAGEALASEYADQSVFSHLDVRQEKDWQNAVELTLSCFGRIDILVNNAGIASGTSDFFDLAAWDRTLAVNTTGCYLGIREVLPRMIEQGSGSIINISSIAAMVAANVHPAYSASKAALRALSKEAALVSASKGVRVNSVHPGIMTAMSSSNTKGDPTVLARRVSARVPMGRVGTADDVTGAVLFLATDESLYITGTEVVIDGGYLAS